MESRLPVLPSGRLGTGLVGGPSGRAPRSSLEATSPVVTRVPFSKVFFKKYRRSMVRSFPVRPPAILLLLAEGRRQRADTQWKRVVAGSAGTSSGGRSLKDGRLVRVNVLQRLNDYPIPSALFAASEPRPNRMGQAGVLPGPPQSIEIRHRCRSGLGKRSALPDLVPARRLVAGSERSLATTWAQEPADRRFNTPVTQRGFNEIDPSLSASGGSSSGGRILRRC